MQPIRLFALILCTIAVIDAQAGNEQDNFSVVFNCGSASEPSYCLANPFEPGLSVILIKRDRSGLCTAKTRATFAYEGAMQGIESTKLTITEKCTGPFTAAILRAAPNAVQIPRVTNTIKSLKQLDSEARKIVERPDAPSIYRLASEPPRVFAVNNATLLLYTFVSGGSGPGAVVVSNRPMRLEGECIREHAFFNVKGKLHLFYWWTGCNSGQSAAVIYDLSAQVPKKVYVNGKFST